MSIGTAQDFFFRFPMRRTRVDELDGVLANSPKRLDVLFLWGRDCVNCDIAKHALLGTRERCSWPDVRWLHNNVYDDPTMGTRFGLHGVPAFMVFHRTLKVGRISAWPGADAFVAAIEHQRTRFDDAAQAPI
ncbi:MAG: hypothetical protein ABI650_02475 [Dokdonella sp.]